MLSVIHFSMALIEGETNEIIVSSIDKCLDNIGRGFKDIFYWSLENRVGMRRNEILERPESFVKYLEKMFGAGSLIVKEEMKSQIILDLGINWTDRDLANLIRRAVREDYGDFLGIGIGSK